MELDPKNNGVTDTQCQAIGALTFDAGISIAMAYNTASLGGSGASPSKIPGALVNTFKYSNAKIGNTDAALTSIPASNRNNMVNASLNAGLPVLFGIYFPNGTGISGHSVVGDGYGYNGSTMYHHLNMGWSGYEDAWYNLPNIPTGVATFTSVSNVVYNIFTPDKPVRSSGATEIISGRVTDTSGNPLGGATISWAAVASTGAPGDNTSTAATGPSGDNTPTAVTGASGDIAIDTVGGVGGGIWSAVFPPGGKYKFTCTKPGYTFPVTWTVGPIASSTDNSINTGNLWQVDFVGSPDAPLTLNQALDNNTLSFTTSGNANWFPETTSYYYGGSAAQSGAITDSQVSTLQTTVVGPGTLSFYFKVSSELGGDA